MKYSASLPNKNDNVSHDHPAREFALLSGGLALLFLFIYSVLGLFVDLAAEKISFETEAALFAGIHQHLDFKLEPDEEKQAEVQGLVDNLLACSDLPYAVQIYLVKSDEANAIAMPGGNIALFTGLLQAVSTDKGLAFVLAHELGHYHNRDHLRSLGRSLVLFTLSSLITGGDSTISNLLAPSSHLSLARYSQARESLADRTAVDTLYCHYGNVDGAAEFFNSLLDKNGEPDLKVLQYFSSHPDTTKRIADLIQYAEVKGYSPTNSAIPVN